VLAAELRRLAVSSGFRQLLFVQGGGAGTHDEWDNKLVDSLSRELGPNFEIRYPRMPNEDDPAYAAWKAALEKEFATLDDGSILLGHSIGGTILVNALAQSLSARKFGAIFLIAAPFVGEGGWPSEDMNPAPDLGAQLPRDVPVYIYHGLDDATAPPSHAELYARAIPQACVHRLPHRDHQLNNDLSEIAATIKSLKG
jgi:predicted alpha/beta hydrolase family esterase